MSYSVLLMGILAGVIAGGGTQNVGESCHGEDGQHGTCVDLQECRPLYNLYQQIISGYGTDESLRKYTRSICTSQTGEDIVCCVGSRPRITTTRAAPQEQSLLPEKCGAQDLVDNIVGGEPAPLGAWPWMVIFRGRDGGGRSTWFCGGSLITDRYVLSAAHCFRGNVKLEVARIGEHTLFKNPDCNKYGQCAPYCQDIPVDSSSIIVHSSYNSSCNECNDIALIRLSKKATLHTHYVMPICLPSKPEQDMGFSVQDFMGKPAWAAGWGTIDPDPLKPHRPDVLQQVQLPIQITPYCQVLKMRYSDPAMVICAGGEGNDTCRGDSGGPLTLTNNDGTKHFLVGITSKGPKTCGKLHSSGIYTSVHYYLPWIMETLRLQ